MNDKLLYIPLIIGAVPNDKRNEILYEFYKDIRQGSEQEIDILSYLNICREDVINSKITKSLSNNKTT